MTFLLQSRLLIDIRHKTNIKCKRKHLGQFPEWSHPTCYCSAFAQHIKSFFFRWGRCMLITVLRPAWPGSGSSSTLHLRLERLHRHRHVHALDNVLTVYLALIGFSSQPSSQSSSESSNNALVVSSLSFLNIPCLSHHFLCRPRTRVHVHSQGPWPPQLLAHIAPDIVQVCSLIGGTRQCFVWHTSTYICTRWRSFVKSRLLEPWSWLESCSRLSAQEHRGNQHDPPRRQTFSSAKTQRTPRL